MLERQKIIVLMFLFSCVVSVLPFSNGKTASAAFDMEETFQFTRTWEGGYASNPLDPGGSTNFGITQNRFNFYLDSKDLPWKDVKDITEDEIRAIYLEYWNQVKAFRMEQPLAMAMFDTYFLLGYGSLSPTNAGAVEFMQIGLGVTGDGSWGPITEGAFVALPRVNHLELALNIIEQRRQWHYTRVEQNESQEVFLKGWLNRTNDLETTIKGLPVLKTITLNGNAFANGYSTGGTTFVHWKVLDELNIPYSDKGDGLFVVDGRMVQAEKIYDDFYLRWTLIAPGKMTFSHIQNGFNFRYVQPVETPIEEAIPVKVQLNGQDFTDGYFKDGTTFVHWRALDTLNISYTYNQETKVFTIGGRSVKGESFNGSLFIRCMQIYPGKITFKRIDGGYNFIYKL